MVNLLLEKDEFLALEIEDRKLKLLMLMRKETQRDCQSLLCGNASYPFIILLASLLGFDSRIFNHRCLHSLFCRSFNCGGGIFWI